MQQDTTEHKDNEFFCSYTYHEINMRLDTESLQILVHFRGVPTVHSTDNKIE